MLSFERHHQCLHSDNPTKDKDMINKILTFKFMAFLMVLAGTSSAQAYCIMAPSKNYCESWRVIGNTTEAIDPIVEAFPFGSATQYKQEYSVWFMATRPDGTKCEVGQTSHFWSIQGGGSYIFRAPQCGVFPYGTKIYLVVRRFNYSHIPEDQRLGIKTLIIHGFHY